jgi:hypothetical protein
MNTAQIFTANNNELAYDITLALSEGANAIEIYAVDSANNRSAATIALTITRDSQPPVIAFTGARTFPTGTEYSGDCPRWGRSTEGTVPGGDVVPRGLSPIQEGRV